MTDRGTERPAEGADETDADAESSLPPGAHVKGDSGPRGDVDRAEPFGDGEGDLRMVDQPLHTDD